MADSIVITPADRDAIRVLYRIVHHDPPEMSDFLSNAALGKVLRRPTPETERWWRGISTCATEQDARVLAQQAPRLGRYIARLEIPTGVAVTTEQTGRDPGRYTVWGDPALLRSLVVAVVSV